jgi:choline dehydrogenase-like flavoprotein
MHAEFDEKLDSYAGLQISHTLRPANEDDLILETWFNPVGAESLFMPGWFSDHYRNMRRYDHMACVGAVVGTKRNAAVKPGLFGRGLDMDYVVDEDDLKLVVRGLKMAGRAFLEAGALKVMTTTFRYMPCTTEAELDQIDGYVRDNTDIALQSSHPQGGNAISPDPTEGVVDGGFRVHGVERLHVCDASVFPSPITVNPQLTVMALAQIAGQTIE